jgi:glycosyltransferase involved in cell wall biosynthesis
MTMGYGKPSMKILYSHRTRSADGQSVHIRELTNALTARGHVLSIAGPGGAAKINTALSAGGPRGLRKIVPAAIYEGAELGYSLPAFLRLARIAKDARPDILYERYNLFFHAGVWLKKRFGLPMILEVNAPLAEERAAHGELMLGTLARNSEQSIWRAADMVLPVSNVLADRLCAAGVAGEKICVIHNGVSEEFLTPHEPNRIREQYNLQDKLVLGFTGFVRDWHKVDRVIRFLGALGRDDLYLMIVGDGPVRSSLEALAETLGVARRVIFTGIVQREEIPDYVAAFDIALQPAVVDYASPLKLFEYMALGKAIMAPSSANIREVLTSGTDAILFEGDSEDDFGKNLLRLVEDRALRARLGASARETLNRKDLTWAGNARRVEVIAEHLLKEKK